MSKKMKKMIVSFGLIAVMMLSTMITAFAAAPRIEEIEYKGNGRVEIDFYGKVRYKNVKIAVKDTTGKTYKVNKIWKDNDEINFNIKNYKEGRTYKITVKGIKTRNTDKYGSVSGKVNIKKAATGKTITAKKALTIAKADASKLGGSSFWDADVEADRYGGQAVWEVNFNGTYKGMPYDFEYVIAKKGGTILDKQIAYDD